MSTAVNNLKRLLSSVTEEEDIDANDEGYGVLVGNAALRPRAAESSSVNSGQALPSSTLL